MNFKAIAVGALALGLAWGAGRAFAPPLLSPYTYSRQVVDRGDRLLRLTLSGDEKYRIFTPLSEIDPQLIEAVLLHEDKHFRAHPGVNPLSLFRAGLHTYGPWPKRRLGGSTITMQLARMTSVTPSRTLTGKVRQIVRAVSFELFHSKDEILEAYLNLLPFGANVEGVGAASLIYFDKPVKTLPLAESLTLAVVPQNPNQRRLRNDLLGSPATGSLKQARAQLFRSWIEVHPTDQKVQVDFDIGLEAKRVAQLPFLAPHFTDMALARSQDPDFRKNGLVRTTLDRTLQELTEKKLQAYITARAAYGINNASALVLNHETMEVVAMVGSANFQDDKIQGQVNGTLAKRSPGSSLKPFTYALAIDQGFIHPMSLLKDTPMAFGAFDPENFDRGFAGPLSATDALTKSRNVPAVYLTSLLTQPTLYEFLKSAGVTRLREPSFYGLSIALGGAEVTMEELVKLYAVLANRGELRDVSYFRNEKNFAKRKPGAQLLSPEAAFLALEMLTHNPRESRFGNEDWMRDTVPVAWKTGTSHGYRDAWTVGVVGPYVIAVWLGNFNGDGNPALIGRDIAAPLFFNLVDGVKNQVRRDHLWMSPVGLNVKKVEVCAISGQMPGEHCHAKTSSWFIPGKSPIGVCTIHRELLVANKTGLRACPDKVLANATLGYRKSVFEFWPSDLLQVFRMAGVPRRAPPAYDPACGAEQTQNSGVAPAITSPRRDVVYTDRIQSGGRKEADTQISFEAVSDGDVRQLHWFVDSEYIGQMEPLRPLFWKAKPGHHVVRVVDDLGRSDARQIEVKLTR